MPTEMPPPADAKPKTPSAQPEREAELALTAACAGGDEAAWEQLYSAYQPLVLRAAERACQRWGVPDAAALAPDVAADLFAHLLADEGRVLSSFAGRARLSTWLRVLTRRRATRLLRRRNPDALESGFEARDQGPSPSEAVQASERQARVRTQLAKLAPRDRLALQLFYEGDKSYREVAQVLDLPVNRIGTLLARARDRLARILSS
ncbi:MAG: sigma-70 family RNA polymerase sigma factor [Planctomycetes bacterium]|nr:sigma-70 family RNA polymerase sigma factor [Planctomycetota bacterium]